MKKFSLLILSILMILSMVLAACQQAPEEAAGGPGAGQYYRLVTHGGDDPFWAVVQQGMRDACAELGCEADIDLAGGTEKSGWRRRGHSLFLIKYRFNLFFYDRAK